METGWLGSAGSIMPSLFDCDWLSFSFSCELIECCFSGSLSNGILGKLCIGSTLVSLIGELGVLLSFCSDLTRSEAYGVGSFSAN